MRQKGLMLTIIQSEEGYEQRHLPHEEQADLGPDVGVGGHQRQAGLQCPRRADPLAEPGVAVPVGIENEEGQDEDRQGQDDVLQ